MHRRSLGSGHRLAAMAAVLIVVGSVLPWYQVGGDGGLPVIVYRAFDGIGFVSFLAGLATLALLALPYAAGERPMPLDRGVSFALLALAAIAGVILWIPTSNVLADPAGLVPTKAYGYWITVIGAALLGRAAFEIYRWPERR